MEESGIAAWLLAGAGFACRCLPPGGITTVEHCLLYDVSTLGINILRLKTRMVRRLRRQHLPPSRLPIRTHQ
jgi:hypothetical protein